MNIKSVANLYVSQKDTELISLFIQYHKGELSGKSEIEIEKIIESCEECKMLYNDISSFYNHGEVLLYGIKNQERINNGKKLLNKLHKHFPGDDLIDEPKRSHNLNNRNCCC